jgi:hypothetical protein
LLPEKSPRRSHGEPPDTEEKRAKERRAWMGVRRERGDVEA